ncbi:hypothetical protein [Afipia carboxidovorans]|uniref:hypothetical protein n=1 Tax=Afipia carboxidovorans TaxID=40137 RepID=UPI0030895CD7|nr:hypothetical protein CRBSH125_01760 [Afipia carboxidovorans]
MYEQVCTDEFDTELVALGLMSEEERVLRAYRRIFRQQMKRGWLPSSRPSPITKDER